LSGPMETHMMAAVDLGIRIVMREVRVGVGGEVGGVSDAGGEWGDGGVVEEK